MDTKTGRSKANNLEMGTLLNARQLAFCKAYVENGHNTLQAMLTAGYSDTYAQYRQQTLLKNVNIQAYITKLEKRSEAITGITAERVLDELSCIAFFNVQNLYDSIS